MYGRLVVLETVSATGLSFVHVKCVVAPWYSYDLIREVKPYMFPPLLE